MSKTDPRKMTVGEVAAELKISRQRANKLVDDGMFGEVSRVSLNSESTTAMMVKAVSRERVLTYIEETSLPEGTVSVQEAADRLGCNSANVYALGRRGTLELVKYRWAGSRMKSAVRLSSLKALLASRGLRTA